MKTRIHLTAKSKLRHVPFALICLLIASAGWAAKLELNRFERMEDELQQDFMRPCLVNTRVQEQQNNLIAPARGSGSKNGVKPAAPNSPPTTRID